MKKIYFIFIASCLFSLASYGQTCVGHYATLPYAQNFENWINFCGTDNDAPDSSWVNGNAGLLAANTHGWRREDYSTWGVSGLYSPTAESGSHSARFHTISTSPAGSTTFDLYINCGGTSGSQQLNFYYINTAGTDNMKVSLSTDGGASFAPLATYVDATTWVLENLAFTSTSATTILRFTGTSISGGNGSSDIGLDNLSVFTITPCSNTPSVGIISPANVDVTSCSPAQTFTISGYPGITGLTYQWEQSTDGITYAPLSGATTAAYTAIFTAPVTYLNCIVTCVASGLSTISETATITYTPQTYLAVTVATPYTQDFENTWLSRCGTDDAPDKHWINTPVTGQTSWRRDDDGASAGWNGPTDGTYTPAGSNANGGSSAHSARFHVYFTPAGDVGSLDLYLDLSAIGNKQISYDYTKTTSIQGGTDSLIVLISTTGPNGPFTSLDSIATASPWTTRTITTSATSPTCVLRFLGVSDDGVADIGLDNVSVIVLTPCAGTPPAGAVSPANATLMPCGAPTQFFALSGYAGVSGLMYQWQQSTDNGITYTSVSGATDNTYTGTFTAPTTLVKCIVTCTASGQSTTTAASTVTYSPQLYFPVTAADPYTQGFENQWLSKCATDDAPDTYWINNPSTGDNSWRRNDDVASANWDDAFITYFPAGSDANGGSSAHSAAFDSYDAYNGTTGTMDLYLDLSAPGTKQISYDCIFQGDGSFSGAGLTVLISTTGPTGPFTQIDQLTTSPNWATRAITDTTTSATCVLRFLATSDFNNDLGLDNININVLNACSGMPVAGTFSSTPSAGCVAYAANLSVDAPVSATGISYQWQSSADGVTYTSIAGATGTNYTVSVTANTYYRFYVKCANSNDSAFSAGAELMLTPEVASVATIPYFQGFESWTGSCSPIDRPDANWLNNPTTGANSWRRNDQGTDAGWFAPNFSAPSPSSTEGAYSARFHGSVTGLEGDLDLHINLSTPGEKLMTFDYYNTTGTNYLTVALSEDGGNNFTVLNTLQSGDVTGATGWAPQTITFTSVAANAVIRFAATGTNSSSSDIDIDSLNITLAPCDTVMGLAVTNITQASATVNWTAVGGTGGYDVIVDQSAANPAGPDITDLAATYNATGLLIGTTYYAHVRDSCGPNNFSAWTTIPFTTTSCDTVTGLGVSGITQTGATINWTAVGGTAGYEVVVDQSAGNPAGSGISDIAATYNATGLVTGITYYAHVRDSCGPNNFSAWTTISFTTLSCDTVTGLAVTGIAQTAATISWTAAGTGYDIVVDQSSANPIGSGTSTTAASYNATGLVTGTTYYAHVRDSCGPNNFSAWTTISFTTLSCDSITNLAATAITQTGATIHWSAVTGTSGYEIAAGSLPATIVLPVTGTVNNSYPLTGLTANTTYYVVVRDSCGADDFSVWDTLAFTTPPSAGIANINGNNGLKVNMIPNPATEQVTIIYEAPRSEKTSVRIMNMTGQSVVNIELGDEQKGSVVIPLHNVAAGMYMVELICGSEIVTQRLVKQ